MDDIMRVQDLISELEKLPMNAPVLVNVVKYPDEFQLKIKDNGDLSWDESDDVEACPLEHGEIQHRDGIVYLCVELTDYSEERREHLGRIS